MGIRLRKTIRLGALRFTLSKSGISTSLGVPGFRKTINAAGREQTTVSLPGTGISHVSSKKLGQRKTRGNSNSNSDSSNTEDTGGEGEGVEDDVRSMARISVAFLLAIGLAIGLHAVENTGHQWFGQVVLGLILAWATMIYAWPWGRFLPVIFGVVLIAGVVLRVMAMFAGIGTFEPNPIEIGAQWGRYAFLLTLVLVWGRKWRNSRLGALSQGRPQKQWFIFDWPDVPLGNGSAARVAAFQRAGAKAGTAAPVAAAAIAKNCEPAALPESVTLTKSKNQEKTTMQGIDDVAKEFRSFATHLRTMRPRELTALTHIQNGFEPWLNVEFGLWLASTRLPPLTLEGSDGNQEDLGFNADVALDQRFKEMDKEKKRCNLWCHSTQADRYHYVEIEAVFEEANRKRAVEAAAADYWYLSHIRGGEAQPASGAMIFLGHGFDSGAWESALRDIIEYQGTDVGKIALDHGGLDPKNVIRWAVFTRTY